MDESRPGDPAHAYELASERLELARRSFYDGDMQAALENSRDCMRLVSSAILFRDGYVTNDFDKTVRYLSKRYDSIFPLRDWERAEMTYLGSGGLYNMIMAAMGKPKKTDRELVGEALKAAERFFETARRELGA